MTEIFLKLLNMSFTASFLVIAVLLIRFGLKQIPKWTRCLMWGLVAVRLICPFSVESVLSLVPSAELIPAEIETMEKLYWESDINNGAAIDEGAYLNQNTDRGEMPARNANSLDTWISGATIVWISGLIAMLFYAGISFALLYRRVQASISVGDNIYICDDIASPFIFGIFRPRIYLPSGMEESNSKYVIAHERAHLKRLDHLWKPFGFLVLSIHWFNPLVWVAYVMLCRDIEFACDEKVIKNMNMEDKKRYSMALVTGNVSRKMIAACPVSFGETGVKERVKSVLHYKKPTLWVMLTLTLLLFGVLIFFMTNPVREDAANAEPSYRMLTDKYRDLTTVNGANVPPADISFDDRHFICEGEVHNTLEEMVYDLYYCGMEGSYDHIESLIGSNKSLQIAFQNERKQFEDGIYMSEYRIHELRTLTAEEVQKLSEEAKNDLGKSIETHKLTEYAIVMLDISWKHNEKALSMSPQLGDGRYIRYYLLGESKELPEYRIYEVYWGEYFAPEGVFEPEVNLEDGVNSAAEAVALVQKQMIIAYENKFGHFEPLDVDPRINERYPGDAAVFAYEIPRFAVSEETEEYYVIPVVWDFRVYKDTGEVRVYYNGIDSFEYTFDPTNAAHISFAG